MNKKKKYAIVFLTKNKMEKYKIKRLRKWKIKSEKWKVENEKIKSGK